MTAGGGQDWRGGRAPRKPGAPEQAAPSWKQSRSTAAAARRGGWKSKLKVLFGVGLLVGLVAAAIAIFNPDPPLHTHLVVMNLLQGSTDYDPAAAIAPAEALSSQTRTRRFTVGEAQSGDPASADAGRNAADLSEATNVIVWLQSVIVPVSDGWQILVRNSTPNLGTREESVPLSAFKEHLTAILKARPNRRVLLLIDEPPTNARLRTGVLDGLLDAELSAWAGELDGLVIVRAAGDGSTSQPGTPATSGRTIFAQVASDCLSRQADSSGDGNVSVHEYCTAVASRTDAWVRKFRQESGQPVRVFPSLDQLAPGSARDFLLVKDVADVPGADGIEVAALDESAKVELLRLWDRRQKLAALQAWRWNPLRWVTITDGLIRAEAALRTNHMENLSRGRQNASQSLDALEQETAVLCPADSDLNRERGLLKSDFAATLSWPRAAKLWPDSPPADTSRTALVETVITAQLDAFPWGEVGLQRQSQPGMNQWAAQRSRLETAVATAIQSSWRIPATLAQAEQLLLNQEDRLFLNSAASPETLAPIDAEPLLASIEAFVPAHDASVTTFALALSDLPGVVQFAAEANGIEPAVRREWMRMLSLNAPDREPDASLQDQLRDALAALPVDERTPATAAVDRVRRAALTLLVRLRHLQRSLNFNEPESGFGAVELGQVGSQLSAAQQQVQESLGDLATRIEAAVSAVLEEAPPDRSARLRVRQQVSQLLHLTSLSGARRRDLLDRLSAWDELLAQETDGEKQAPAASSQVTEQTASEAPTIELSSVQQEALWWLQGMNLHAANGDHAALVDQAWQAGQTLALAVDAPSARTPLAGLGECLRQLQQAQQESMRKAAQTTTADVHELLREADQLSSLTGAFDAARESWQAPSIRLRAFDRWSHAVQQTDRLVQGQWVETADAGPFDVNGWYARQAGQWLDVAARSLEAVSTGSGPPAFAAQRVQTLRDRLKESAAVRIEPLAAAARVELGEQNQPRRSTAVTIAGTASPQLTGAASLLARLPGNQSPSAGLQATNNASPLTLPALPADMSLEFYRPAPPGSAGCQPFDVPLEVFFRGRRWRSGEPLKINACAPAEFVVELPARRPTATVTLDGTDRRPVSLILDWSSSMTDKLTGTQVTRAQAALDTLRKLIDNEILQDSRVSLTVYGHRINYNGTDPDGPGPRTRGNEFNAVYEDVFQKKIDRAKNALQDIETEFPMTRFDPDARDELNGVLDKIKNVPPFGITPLAGAITRGLTTELRGEAGIVIAVTDGEAKDIGPADDPGVRARNQQQQEFLQEALNAAPASRAVIVAFDVKQDVAARTALQSLFDQQLGIKVLDAANESELLNQILETLRRPEFQVRSQGIQTRTARLGESVEGLPEADDYQIEFEGFRTTTDVALRAGDEVTVRIDRVRRQLVFLRPQPERMQAGLGVAADSPPDAPRILRSLKPPVLTFPEGDTSQAFCLAELALMLDHARLELPVRQPAEADIRVRPANSEFRPANVQVEYSSASGAPGWLVRIDQWPREQDFVVNAMWKASRTAPDIVRWWTDFVAAVDPGTAIPIQSGSLPACTAWTQLRADGVWQIRLDPVDKQSLLDPDGRGNAVQRIRVELGKRDTKEQNSTFKPLDINHRIVQLDTGAVVHEFSQPGGMTASELETQELAFTSWSSLQSGATVVEGFRIPRP